MLHFWAVLFNVSSIKPIVSIESLLHVVGSDALYHGENKEKQG